ncbi:hypothetical protein [Roseofilum casamattae]|uniref:Uncharacterized protein n=1 Tax=Roseofilum casamattae BLCC-M143 TaxID=3022442 RepID=A0ABT7BWW8_9CYAN|nr:hypothetical protein [Roseofilum casamattae]MDJ1183661.1 hypothetical protein [Roseofilum casamattae BLCC-M143]
MPQLNPAEITDALNTVLQAQGVTAKALVKEGCLHILLEGEEIPEQDQYVPVIQDEILNMGIESVPTLQIYGRQTGMKKPSWSETIDLLQLREEEEDLPNFALDDPDDDMDYDESYDSNGHGMNGSEADELDDEEPDEKKKTPLSKYLPLLAIPILALIGGAVWWFVLRPSPDIPPVPALAPETPSEEVTTEPASEPVEASPASTPPASTDPWRDGINAATQASQAAQTASTRAEWEAVASQWQQARDLMAQVPEDNENYSAAQERVISYGDNANSALTWAERSN